jgi:valyl-tRNA synthetase
MRASSQTAAAFEPLRAAVDRLARVRSATVADGDVLEAGAGPRALAVMTRTAEARLERGEADAAKERARLEKELAQAERLRAETEARLADEKFVSRAPAAVVEAARTRLAELEELVAKVSRRLDP